MCVLLSLFFVGCLAWNCSCFFFLCYIVVIFLCVDLCRLQMLFFFPIILLLTFTFLSYNLWPSMTPLCFCLHVTCRATLTVRTGGWTWTYTCSRATLPCEDLTLISHCPLPSYRFFFFSRFLKQQNKTKQTNKLTNKEKKKQCWRKKSRHFAFNATICISLHT